MTMILILHEILFVFEVSSGSKVGNQQTLQHGVIASEDQRIQL